MEFEGRTLDLVKRGVEALEALAKDPEVNIEVGPPICPHCGTLNPEIYVREEEMSGPFFEFILRAQCQTCKEIFYSLPLGWYSYKSQTELREELQLREEAMKSGSNGN